MDRLRLPLFVLYAWRLAILLLRRQLAGRELDVNDGPDDLCDASARHSQSFPHARCASALAPEAMSMISLVILACRSLL